MNQPLSTPVHESVSAAAALYPDADAVVDADRVLSYSGLEAESNKLANALIRAGLRSGDLVGLILPKSADVVVTLLAALKCGAAYVPLDVSSPPARLAMMLESASPRWVVAHPDLAPVVVETLSSVTETARPRVCWTGPRPAIAGSLPGICETQIAAAPPTNPAVKVGPDDLAYVMFTSGSTGTPKGVPIAHRSVTRFTGWAAEHFGLGPKLRVSGHTPVHFDLSVMDIFGALTTGAELHLVPEQANLTPHLIADFLRKSRLNQWFSVPAVLVAMAGWDVVAAGDFPDLRTLIWCGDALPVPALRHLMQRLPHVRFTNLYGPTEATVACSYHEVDQIPDLDADPIPIGRPITGARLAVLDETGHPLARGAVGDLYIAGDGLSPGYLHDPEKTAEAFFVFPEPPQRWYRTGDLARLDEQGIVHFHGRADRQVKSRGYRVELDDVASALHKVAGVTEAAVVATDADGFAGKEICAAYVPDETAPTPRLVRAQLGSLLPAYMVPTRWLRLTALPKNQNGKVDHRAVLQRFLDEARSAAEPAAKV